MMLMSKPRAEAPAAGVSLDQRMSFDDFLAKLSPKDRNNVEKHLAAIGAGEAGDRHVATWRRLVTSLTTLAPHQVRLGADHSLLFFVPDGPYKMQVFAMRDARDGTIDVYCGDVLEQAVTEKLIRPAPRKPGAAEAAGPEPYRIEGVEETLPIERFDGRIDNLPVYSKNLVGWNRKAVRIHLTTSATEHQLRVTEQLCALTTAKLPQPA
jgi:hypothetical protein